ncbi:MAG TPA: hypothetical protein PLN94_19150, partial [Thiolinea sp.]|nr:hypothetical protein [Thiolinea sp.]
MKIILIRGMALISLLALSGCSYLKGGNPNDDGLVPEPRTACTRCEARRAENRVNKLAKSARSTVPPSAPAPVPAILTPMRSPASSTMAMEPKPEPVPLPRQPPVPVKVQPRPPVQAQARAQPKAVITPGPAPVWQPAPEPLSRYLHRHAAIPGCTEAVIHDHPYTSLLHQHPLPCRQPVAVSGKCSRHCIRVSSDALLKR